MKRLIIPILLCVVVIACSKSEQKVEDRLDADVLYKETCRLVKLYTDSMQQTCDSTDISRITMQLEQHLDSLNSRLRVDSDLKLTGGQNDTIYMLMSKYNRIRRQKIAQYGISKPDTIELLHDAVDTLQYDSEKK